MTVTGGDIRRVPLGSFVRPGSETLDGAPRAEVVLGYVVRHPAGLLLFDTGIGEADEETDEHYRPKRRPLREALASVGVRIDDITQVVNCHLHFDHCGGNPLLTGRPVFSQRTELDLAQQPGYTVPALVDVPGLDWQLLDGDAEILPDVHLIATPGHTAGHQSLVVRCDDGTVVLAGQSHDHASDFTAHQLAADLNRAATTPGALPTYPEWLPAILDLDPRRVLFAHDLAVWEP